MPFNYIKKENEILMSGTKKYLVKWCITTLCVHRSRLVTHTSQITFYHKIFYKIIHAIDKIKKKLIEIKCL